MGGQRVKGVGQEEGEDGVESSRRMWDMSVDERQERQAGWWFQLMQSSQVYINQSAEGSKFVKTEKKKKSSSDKRQGHLPPTREGVVEGAESSQEGEESQHRVITSGSRGRPSWMGSPPESVLNQEKDTQAPGSKAAAAEAPGSRVGAAEAPGSRAGAAVPEESPSQGQSLRWSRLFGSSAGSLPKGEGPEHRGKVPKCR